MNINKPITIIREDFIQTLTSVINNSMLPPFVIEPILKDMYLETKTLSQRQLEQDKAKYENDLLQAEQENKEVEICE